MEMTIKQFCKKHGACRAGREWAVENCKTMREAWDTAPEPEWVVWIGTQPGVLTDRELRLFACFCARQNWHLLTDPRSRNAVEVAERYAEGNASQEELEAAAWAAAGTAAWAAAREMAGTAAEVAADAAAAAAAAAAVAGRSKRAGKIRDGQAAWLRENCKLNFEVKCFRQRQ